MTTLELQKMANEVRKGIVTAVHSAKAGHPGGSLSAADVFTYLYFEEMNIDPKNPKDPDRDRFVLSKGHTAPGYYSAMAHRGYFPVEDLVTLRHIGSHLQDRAFPLQLEWHWQEKWTKRITVCTRCLAMARFRRARYGRLPCSQDTESWTIW